MINPAIWIPAVGALACLVAIFVRHDGLPGEPVATRPLGLVVHHLDAIHVAAVVGMGVTAVRIPWYGDLPDLLAQLALALDAKLQVVIVANAPVTETLVANTPASVIIQVGNEPVDPVLYAAQFRQVVQAFGGRVTLWPAGLSNGVDALTIRKAIDAGLADTGIVCLHAYGSPLVNAVHDRLDAFAAATTVGLAAPHLVFTELGATQPKAGDLGPALAAVPATVETFLYDLDGTDGFALTPAEQNTVATFTGVVAH